MQRVFLILTPKLPLYFESEGSILSRFALNSRYLLCILKSRCRMFVIHVADGTTAIVSHKRISILLVTQPCIQTFPFPSLELLIISAQHKASPRIGDNSALQFDANVMVENRMSNLEQGMYQVNSCWISSLEEIIVFLISRSTRTKGMGNRKFFISPNGNEREPGNLEMALASTNILWHHSRRGRRLDMVSLGRRDCHR